MENCKELFREMLAVLREHNASGKNVTREQLTRTRDIAFSTLNALGDGDTAASGAHSNGSPPSQLTSTRRPLSAR